MKLTDKEKEDLRVIMWLFLDSFKEDQQAKNLMKTAKKLQKELSK